MTTFTTRRCTIGSTSATWNASLHPAARSTRIYAARRDLIQWPVTWRALTDR